MLLPRKSMVGVIAVLGALACRDATLEPARELTVADAVTPGPSPEARICKVGSAGNFQVVYDDHPLLSQLVSVPQNSCVHVSGLPSRTRVTVRVTELPAAGFVLDSIVKDSITWNPTTVTHLPPVTNANGGVIYLVIPSPTALSRGGDLTFYNTPLTTTVTVCTQGTGASFALSGGASGTATLGAGQCQGVASRSGADPAITVLATEQVPAQTVLDSIVVTGPSGHTKIVNQVAAAGTANIGGGSTITFYNRVVAQTTVRICTQGAGAQFRLSGAVTTSPFINGGQCQVVATHNTPALPTMVQATELVPTGVSLDSIVTIGPSGRLKLIKPQTVGSGVATDAGGATVTFYNRVIPTTTVTVCSRGVTGTFALSGASPPTVTVANGACLAVASHRPNASQVNVQVRMNLPAGTILDSIIVVGAGGRTRLLRTAIANGIANDAGGTTITYFSRFIPPSTVTICSQGAGANFRMTGGSVANTSLAANQCQVVGTHVGGTAQLTVLITENLLPGTVLDSVVTTGVGGRSKVVGRYIVSAIATDAGGSTVRFYNRVP